VEGNFAAVTEPKEVTGLLMAIDAYNGAVIVQSAFRLASLVLKDKSKSRRTDVDGYLILPLSLQAVDVLKGIHAFSGDEVCVFRWHPSSS
jgi:hypothetical protein